MQSPAIAVCSKALWLRSPLRRTARRGSELCEDAAADFRQIRFMANLTPLRAVGVDALPCLDGYTADWRSPQTQRRDP